MSDNLWNNKILISAILFVIAVSIQIQITILANENYNGLRINLADFLIPFLGIFVFLGVLLKKTNIPQLHIKHPLIWLSILLAILSLSLFHSYYLYNTFSQWALINKTIGFIVLIAYFLLGGWLGNNISKVQLIIFFRTFFLFFILILVLQTFDYIAVYCSIKEEFFLPPFPASGLIANKNTFIFLYCLVLTFSSLLNFNNKRHSILLAVLYSLLPLTFIFTGSRVLLILIPILLPFLLYFSLRKNKLIIILSLLIGLIFALSFNAYKTKNPTSYQLQNYTVFSEILSTSGENIQQKDFSYAGDQLRIDVLKVTISMIKDRPILGSGLGSIITTEISKDFPGTIIDSTPLWLWVETGLIGLLIFLSFYALCLKKFWQNGFNKHNDETTQALHKSAFIMLLIFGFMCLLHELIYTRFLWFFMGLVLAYPIKPSALRQN